MSLMHKIVLSCKQATFYSSVQAYKKLKKLARMQHKLHLMMCPSCKRFDNQSKIIDQSMQDLHQNKQFLSDELLSSDKKTEIKSSVNQHIN